MKNLLLALFVLISPVIMAQELSYLSGIVTDSTGIPVELANVAILGTGEGTMTDAKGYYLLEIPSGKSFTVVVSFIGYRSQQFAIKLDEGENRKKDILLGIDVRNLKEVSVRARQERASTFQRIDVKDLTYMPTTTGKVEAIIKSQAGVSSNNELSSQYSVRGGNYDENLVYVNDIQIYRPFLVRSGQQEGLSFVNSDLVSSVKFSAGGFDARYGDKMSSALDINYKRPTEFGGSASVSLLGASTHLEGSTKDRRFTYLAGYRYKTTSYLLNSLETEGDYKPQFSDFQTMLRFTPSRKLEVSFLGNYSSNKYHFIPSETDVEFGTKDLPLNLKIFYEGQELDRFDTYLGALAFNYKPVQGLSLKLTASAFRTSEQETFDILGQYWINELDNTLGSETYGDSILNVGVGSTLSHARNYLDAIVVSANHIGSYEQDNYHLQWGFSYQYQEFFDRIREWELQDSSGFIIPYNGKEIILGESKKADNVIAYDQFSAFVQNTWEVKKDYLDLYVTSGLRASFWNYNPSTFLSPPDNHCRPALLGKGYDVPFLCRVLLSATLLQGNAEARCKPQREDRAPALRPPPAGGRLPVHHTGAPFQTQCGGLLQMAQQPDSLQD